MPKRHLIIVLCAGLLLMFGLAAAQDGTNARVKSMATTLRLRESPSVLAATIVELSGGTALNVIGRTAGGGWYKVEAEGGLTGWVSSGYVEIFVGLSSVPILTEGVTVPPPYPRMREMCQPQPRTTVEALPMRGLRASGTLEGRCGCGTAPRRWPRSCRSCCREHR